MNIQFRKLHLPQPPEVDADALIELAGNKKDSGLNPPALPNGVTRSKTISRSNLDEIIQDIVDSNTQKITVLEWVCCLYNKDKWDSLNPKRSRTTSEAIWKAAEQNTWLKQRLFWNLVLNYDSKITLASSLLSSASVFHPRNSSDREIIKIVQILGNANSAYELAELCSQKKLTPYQLFLKHRLPTKALILNQALENTVAIFASITNPSQLLFLWIMQCLEEMKAIQQVKTVEQLLIKVDPKLGTKYPEIIDWLRKYYGSSVPNSRWNELSSQSKTAMRKWLGAVSYQDFQRLVSLILDRVHLVEHEHKRLKSRSGFWSNYSDRFERIRILLPQSSVEILGSYLNNQDVEILQEDGSDPSEVCIFDFGNWFLVEFFRGNGSETRIFPKNTETEQQLFNFQLSIKKLRCLGSNNPIHDHEYIWQYFCEQWLRQKSILPNTGIENFKGLPYRYSKYNWQTGLPKPLSENVIGRDRKLEYWKKNIASLEQDARGYC